MNKYGRFKPGKRGGVYKPRFVPSDVWADNLLASDATLPRGDAYRWGLICAHSLHQRPDAPGLANHFDTDTDRALWQQAYEHAQFLIAHYGV